eukprot:scaffold460440_cov33-Prasinocladus_malaysianus.AAC.1
MAIAPMTTTVILPVSFYILTPSSVLVSLFNSTLTVLDLIDRIRSDTEILLGHLRSNIPQEPIGPHDVGRNICMKSMDGTNSHA